ncbi:unnamed protein product [Ixodes persulcatus]
MVDTEGRFICCDIYLEGIHWRLICVYAYNDCSSRLSFFQNLDAFLDTDKCIVLFGDFNCVCEAHDRSTISLRRDNSSIALDNLVRQHCLSDVGASRTSINRFTHLQSSGHARLDRIYVSSCLLEHTFQYLVTQVSFSDHCVVTGRLGEKRKQMFRSKWALWKLNNNLLKNNDFNERLITCFMVIRSNTDLSIFAQWDSFKEEAKNIAIECACIQTYYEKADRRALTHSLHELYALECEKPGNFHKEICFLKSELQSHELQRYRGAAVRSRCQRLVSAKQPTKNTLDDER